MILLELADRGEARPDGELFPGGVGKPRAVAEACLRCRGGDLGVEFGRHGD